MQYALLLKTHPNEHYRQALEQLSVAELYCCLKACGYEDASPFFNDISGNRFLCFEASCGDEGMLKRVSSLSFVALLAEVLPGGLLKPLSPFANAFLPAELPHVLKYKGKTNADFTRMMLNCALYLSDYAGSEAPLSLIDPMCGKGTSLFCGSVAGMDTVGMDIDKKELREADLYLGKSLQLHRISYNRSEESLTLRSGGGAKRVRYSVSSTERNNLTISFIECDLQKAAALFKKGSFHLLVCDMPYGVQHAPKDKQGLSSLNQFCSTLSEVSYYLLKNGGTAAISFNEKTLSKAQVLLCLESAGLEPIQSEPLEHLSHYVEQAIVRNVVFAKKCHN